MLSTTAFAWAGFLWAFVGSCWGTAAFTMRLKGQRERESQRLALTTAKADLAAALVAQKEQNNEQMRQNVSETKLGRNETALRNFR